MTDAKQPEEAGNMERQRQQTEVIEVEVTEADRARYWYRVLYGGQEPDKEQLREGVHPEKDEQP